MSEQPVLPWFEALQETIRFVKDNLDRSSNGIAQLHILHFLLQRIDFSELDREQKRQLANVLDALALVATVHYGRAGAIFGGIAMAIRKGML